MGLKIVLDTSGHAVFTWKHTYGVMYGAYGAPWHRSTAVQPQSLGLDSEAGPRYRLSCVFRQVTFQPQDPPSSL